MPPGGAGGAADDQRGPQVDGVDGHAVEQAGQGVIPALAQGEPVLPDGGEGRGHVGGDGLVVEAHNAHVLGDVQAAVVAFRIGRHSPAVVGAQNGRGPLFDELGQVLPRGFRHVVPHADELLVQRKAALLQRAAIGAVPLLQHVGLQRPAEQADAPVAQAVEVAHRRRQPAGVITAHRGHAGVLLNAVVIEDGGDGGGAEFLHPGVQQGEAQHERPPPAPVGHELLIGDAALVFLGKGHHVNRQALRPGHLLKAHDKVIAELVGVLVSHILNEDAQLFQSAPAGIAQLGGGFQYPLTQLLAHVGGVVQSLGDGALGYSQLGRNVV